MPFVPTPPTHNCESCHKALWSNRWPYSMCKACGEKPCVHGNKNGDCGQCDLESDRAYDAARGK